MTDLDKLSAAATEGEWGVKPKNDFGSVSICSDTWCYGEVVAAYICCDGAEFAGCYDETDAALICAAVNALRAGELVEAGRLRELVAEWREQGNFFGTCEDRWERGHGAAFRKLANKLAEIIGDAS